jgi:hypothetical protein
MRLLKILQVILKRPRRLLSSFGFMLSRPL